MPESWCSCRTGAVTALPRMGADIGNVLGRASTAETAIPLQRSLTAETAVPLELMELRGDVRHSRTYSARHLCARRPWPDRGSSAPA